MVEFKPLFTGVLEPGVHEVYACESTRRAAILIIRLKNKGAAATISVAGNWGDDDVEQFPDNYQIGAGEVASDPNFKLMFDGTGTLVITVGEGGLIHCYLGGIERTK